MKRAGRYLAIITLFTLLLGGCMADTPAPSVSVDETDTQIQKEQENSAETGNHVESDSEVSAENNNTETNTEERQDMNQHPMAAITAKDVVSEMKIGWSLGNTLDSTNTSALKKSDPRVWETCWGNPETTKEAIKTVTDRGFNVIRIPVSWGDHLLVAEDYKIVDSWMDRVQEVVDYAYEEGVYVILNLHHEEWHMPYYDNQEKASEILTKVWTQIAERFKDYDEHLIFEGMNEPRKKGTPMEWNGGDQEGWDVVNHLNGVFIDTIRNSGGNNPYRILMIPGYAANCWEGIKHVEVPEDDNKIIVSVHAYEPYNFALNTAGTKVWNKDTWNIDAIMKSLDDLFISKDIPVVIGEFGAMHKDDPRNLEERAAWAEYYVSAAKKLGIPCVWWDNGAFEGDGELFGLLDRETCQWKYEAVVEGLFKGLE